MANPIVFDPPPSNSESDGNIYAGGDDLTEQLPIPPLEFDMLIDDFALPENFTFGFNSNEDLDFNLEDLEFIDNLHFDPGPGSNCVSPDHRSSLPQHLPNSNPGNNSFSASPETKVSSNPCIVDHSLNADIASDSGITWDSDPAMAYNTHRANSELDSSGSASNNHASGSNITQKVVYSSPVSGNCDQLFSQGSGDFNSGLSPDSCQSDRHFSTSSDNSISKAKNLSANVLEERESRIKIEEVGSKGTSKRKKGQNDAGSAETRTSKFIRSSAALENAIIDLSTENEVDDKKKARLTRNRESAHLSRQRKKNYVEELEDKVKFMHSTITDLKGKVSYIMAENVTLRQQLGGGVCPPLHAPPPGIYPIAPMGYPWMPFPTYVVKPHGSHVPLVPIPRLKPQQPASAPKAKKKSENKKNVGKTKKVASVSFLGLLFFIFLFGGLVPLVHVKYGDKLIVADKFSKVHKGRILMVDGNVIDSSNAGGSSYSGRRRNTDSGIDGSVPVRNSSEPLAASLYVPRNDKLVKIDGNLIINSVLASERAMASPGAMKMKTSEETRLAIARNYVPSYHVTDAGMSNTRGSHHDDGRLQQWFREDLSGSMLSSGMCTEVFQFDVSPTPGSIVPVTTITNATSNHRCNSANLKKPRNRRILSEHSIPLNNVHALNLTEEHAEPKTEKCGLKGNELRSSMVVSVLVDPRETGDGDGEDVMRSKSFSRIFVVVLIDSVKYVTYSCVLPLMGSSPHSHLVKT